MKLNSEGTGTNWERLGVLILILVTVALLFLSWQKWADLLVDFGVQVYVPWQLTEGKVLYRDIAYLYGPLSVYLHAIIFKIFGPGISTLAFFNIGLIACLSVLIYKIFKRIGTSLSAFFACLGFLSLFAFAQYIPTGNYNFVCPYYYELTHGVFLSFLAILQFMKYLDDRSLLRLGTIGVLTGLVYLTKTEVFLAESGALFVCLILSFQRERLPGKVLAGRLLTLLGTFLIPPILFFLYFSFHMTSGEAFTAIISPWIYLLNPDLRALPYFQGVMGTVDVGGNLMRMFLYTLIFASIILSLYFIHLITRKAPQYNRHLMVLTSLIVVGGAIQFFSEIRWLELMRPLPLFMAGWAFYLFWIWVGKEPDREIKKLPFLAITLFSFFLLFKIILNTHVYHYGFALALPATLVLIKLFLDELPDFMGRTSDPNIFLRPVCMVLVLVFFIPHVLVSANYYRQKIFPVGSDRDLIYDYDPYINNKGMLVKIALDYLKENTDENTKIAAFPLSPMINFWLRKENPSKYTFYNPGVLILFREQTVLESLKRDPPTHVLLVDSNFSEYGFQYFGRDFGVSIHSWVTKNYESLKVIGPKPFSGKGFGVEIMIKTPNPLLASVN